MDEQALARHTAAVTRRWEDFRLGDRIVSDGITVTETHVVGWASLTGDWIPLHVDETYATKTQFGGRIAHGPLTLALALGLVTQTRAFAGGAVAAWLGLDALRALRPVHLGDTVRTEVDVVTTRPTSNATRGLVVLDYAVLNQRDETVMTFQSSFLLNRRCSQGTEAPVPAAANGQQHASVSSRSTRTKPPA